MPDRKQPGEAAQSFSYHVGTGLSRPEYLQAAAQTLLSLIGGDVVGWNLIDVPSRRTELTLYPDDVYNQKSITDKLRKTVDDHPMITSYLRPGATMTPRRLSDVCTRRELMKTQAYSYLLRPMATRHQLTILTARMMPRSGQCWAINRSGQDFTEHDLGIARQLQPLLRILDRVVGTGGYDHDRHSDMVAHLHLTRREIEILHYVSTGLTADAIGRLLRISGRTVRKHLENAYEKLGCHDRLIAVDRARALGLLDTGRDSRALHG